MLADFTALRVREVKAAGGTVREPHEREQHLPGRAKPAATARRAYDAARAKAMKQVPANDQDLMRRLYPDAELMYRWRMKLGCDDIVEVLTLGDNQWPVDKSWSWSGHPMRKGDYFCTAHRATQTQFGRIRRYLVRSTLDLDADVLLKQEARTVGYWTVQLDCGHLGNQITPLDWRPAHGQRQTSPNDPAEVTRRKARAQHVKQYLDEAEWAQIMRRIEEGHLEPDSLARCWVCPYRQPIVAFQRVGWLIPPQPAPAAPPEGATVTRPSRRDLEKRIADLETEIARLRKQ